MSDQTTTIDPTDLPATIRAFLEAHLARDADRAHAGFATDAVVTDQGETFAGSASIRDFLQHAGSEFTYTSRLLGAERLDDARWVALVRLEGDFPGGVAELPYRFVLDGGSIARLDIG